LLDCCRRLLYSLYSCSCPLTTRPDQTINFSSRRNLCGDVRLPPLPAGDVIPLVRLPAFDGGCVDASSLLVHLHPPTCLFPLSLADQSHLYEPPLDRLSPYRELLLLSGDRPRDSAQLSLSWPAWTVMEARNIGATATLAMVSVVTHLPPSHPLTSRHIQPISHQS